MGDPRLGRTTLGEWADPWLDSTVNLRANTKAGYRSILSRYLRPAFGTYPLARIDVLAVRTWLAKLEADGVGQATRAKAYRLLARILGSAVEARFLAVNPCGIRRAASDGAPEMRIATVDQVAAVAQRVPAPPPPPPPPRAVSLPAVVVEGLPRVHDLRHTAGTLATAAGGSLREVMDRLGHSTTVAAVRYQHVMADRDAAIARELNRLIEGA